MRNFNMSEMSTVGTAISSHIEKITAYVLIAAVTGFAITTLKDMFTQWCQRESATKSDDPSHTQYKKRSRSHGVLHGEEQSIGSSKIQISGTNVVVNVGGSDPSHMESDGLHDFLNSMNHLERSPEPSTDEDLLGEDLIDAFVNPSDVSVNPELIESDTSHVREMDDGHNDRDPILGVQQS